MKLFQTLSAVALVQAQAPDFSDLNALFASLTENLAVAPAAADAAAAPADDLAPGARYVIATTTTTTTVAPTAGQTTVQTTGEGCWKCDAMTFASCATSGEWTQCSPDQYAGDYGVCFLELRETNQLLTQLCTGCKSRNACYNLRRQNFVGSTGSNLSRFHDQCKPEWKLQRTNRRYGTQQSVCRTCFSMCPNSGTDASGRKCFGGMEIGTNVDATDLATADFFKYDISTNTGSSTGATKTYWTSQAQAAVIDNHVLGVPLGITCDAAANTQCGAEVSAATNMINWGGSNADTVSGKNQVTGRANGDDVMGLYWAIQDQTKTWWELDHVVVQNIYQDTTAGDSFLARLNNAAEFTGLTALL